MPSQRPSREVAATFRRSFGSRGILREIELIEQPKQFATRGPSRMHVVDAGESRREFLLLQNEDLKFG
jgi:hypothetical protein